MADRYWVGGTDTWNNTAGSKWSTTSGGSPGASVPTSSDDVFFDSNSGTGTIFLGTSTDTPQCKSLNLNGFNGHFGVNEIQLYGDFTSSIGASFENNTVLRIFGTCNIYPNSGIIPAIAPTPGAIVNLTADTTFIRISQVGVFETFNANNFNVTSQGVCVIWANEVNMGSGVWTVGGNFNMSGTNTVNPSTSIVRLVSSGLSTQEFNGGNNTYHKVIFDRGASTQNNYIIGNNTFDELSNLGTAGHELRFGNNSTQTVRLFNVSGSLGNLITIRPNTNSGSNRANLVKTGGGVISSDYLSIVRSNASPSNTWYAGDNSTDQGNNTGWIFTTPPTPPPTRLKIKIAGNWENI